MPGSLLVDVTITIATADLDQLLEGLHISYSGCLTEPECTLFEVSHSEIAGTGTTAVRLFEAWSATKEWFVDVQLKKPYYAPYMEATKHLWTRDRVIHYHERLPKFSFSRPSHYAN